MRSFPFALDDDGYMQLAIEEARVAADLGEVPVGAVVVHAPYDLATRRRLSDPTVIAKAHNLRETEGDASAHAELLAMRQAMALLGRWRLSQCCVYVTLEPCIMCAGLMHQARIERCVYGASDNKAGALGSLYEIHADKRLNHRFEVVLGVCGDECSGILRDFFRNRRTR